MNEIPFEHALICILCRTCWILRGAICKRLLRRPRLACFFCPHNLWSNQNKAFSSFILKATSKLRCALFLFSIWIIGACFRHSNLWPCSWNQNSHGTVNIRFVNRYATDMRRYGSREIDEAATILLCSHRGYHCRTLLVVFASKFPLTKTTRTAA